MKRAKFFITQSILLASLCCFQALHAADRRSNIEISQVSGAGGSCGFRLFLMEREEFVGGAMSILEQKVQKQEKGECPQEKTIRELILDDMANTGAALEGELTPTLKIVQRYGFSKMGIGDAPVITDKTIHDYLGDIFIGKMGPGNGHLTGILLPVAAAIRGVNLEFRNGRNIEHYGIERNRPTIIVHKSDAEEHFNLAMSPATEWMRPLADLNSRMASYFEKNQGDLTTKELEKIVPPLFHAEAGVVLDLFNVAPRAAAPKFDEERIATLQGLLADRLHPEELKGFGYTQAEINEATRRQPVVPRATASAPRPAAPMFDEERITTLQGLLADRLHPEELKGFGYTQAEINEATRRNTP